MSYLEKGPTVGVEVRVTGSFSNSERLLNRGGVPLNVMGLLHDCGKRGVAALQKYTPVASGVSANSWSYEVKKTRGGWEINWINSNVEAGFPIVIGLQYGHATGTGGWVQGRDFINPAMKPVFDQIKSDLRKAVR